jgi:hypothetical protein
MVWAFDEGSAWGTILAAAAKHVSSALSPEDAKAEATVLQKFAISLSIRSVCQPHIFKAGFLYLAEFGQKPLLITPLIFDVIFVTNGKKYEISN